MLELSAALYTAIREHGEQTYPHECCGVLLGHAGETVTGVKQAVRAGNTRTDSAHNRYHIAPGELIRIQREGREQGLDIVGFYHSHPDHPARWSQTDLAEAHWLGCSYVITAVAQGRAVQTNSFRLLGATEDEKHFADEQLTIGALEAGEPSEANASAARC